MGAGGSRLYKISTLRADVGGGAHRDAVIEVLDHFQNRNHASPTSTPRFPWDIQRHGEPHLQLVCHLCMLAQLVRQLPAAKNRGAAKQKGRKKKDRENCLRTPPAESPCEYNRWTSSYNPHASYSQCASHGSLFTCGSVGTCTSPTKMAIARGPQDRRLVQPLIAVGPCGPHAPPLLIPW